MSDKKNEGFATLPSLKDIKNFLASLKPFLFATTLEKSNYFVKIKKDLKKEISGPVKFAIGTIVVTIFIFGVWGGLAPLDSAIMAQGQVVLSGNRQKVQHDSMGVIKRILVKDGDIVQKDQPLIELNPTMATASVNILLSQVRSATAVEKRLLAEESEYKAVDFTSDYLDMNEPDVRRLIDTQNQLFTVRQDILKGKLAAINKHIEQAQEKINGEKGQLKSIQGQLKNARANAEDAERLFKSEAVNKLYVVQTKNEVQRLEGAESQIKANISITEQSIIESRIQLLNTKNEFMNKIEEEYRYNHGILVEAEQKYLQAKEMLDRMVIKAPVDGTVSSLQYHTVGGVIHPHSPIMEITPSDDDLIIDAFVLPHEANTLVVGMPVKIQLTPYKQRLVPRVDGEIIYVSPNTVVNEHIRQEFYAVKIKIDNEFIDKLNADVKLYPGMPVTAFIIRGTRTFLQYLISPITDSFHRAFKEV